MPRKAPKTPTTIDIKSSTYDGSEMGYGTPRSVSLTLILEGTPPGPGDWHFLALFNGQIVLEGRWHHLLVLESEALPLDLKEIYSQQLVADQPLILLLRTIAGKGAKELDPLLHPDNRAGATVDLFPLVLGEEKVNMRVQLVMTASEELTNCFVEACALSPGVVETATIPFVMTLLSAHCLPYAKDGTVYLASVGMNGLLDRIPCNFGMSLSTANATKVVWATTSNAGQAANTTINVPTEDRYIPADFETNNKPDCSSVYWNAMKRVLVDMRALGDRLLSPFLIEIAGVPRTGKIDVRGRYMGFINANVLLEFGQHTVTTCAQLLCYKESELPENVGPLLELPPTSAKISARDTDNNIITDDFGHNAFVIVKFDLLEPIVPKTKLAWLYEVIGFPPPEGPSFPVDDIEIDTPPEDPLVDVRRIRKEGGALAVHKELSSLACRGAVPMNQGIKRTAANRLLMRVRTMLKQFSPGDCLNIEWQDTVTAQHAASRRAVTASFAPHPPPPRPSHKAAAARCRIAGDTRLADFHIVNNIKASKTTPRPLLSKALRSLEERKEMEAKNYLLQALSFHPRNRYLLWTFGGLEHNKGLEGSETACAAFRIAVKGDYSDGTSNAIGWAALHALYHKEENFSAAFVAARKMRKSYELPRDWKKFLDRWIDISGEEETFWIPSVISSKNPMLIAAAFFLCLRCYSFSEKLLQCFENKCATRGSRLHFTTKIGPDIFYIRAASLLLRRELDKALNTTLEGVQRFGPSPMMSQMRATCLSYARGWDGDCERALIEVEKAGGETCPSLLLKAALSGFNIDPQGALQRAARAHKAAPSAHSALTIARIYKKLGEEILAERWAAGAVKVEPLLADGWAFLALLAMYQKDVHRARTMLRTAKQVGPVSLDLDTEVKKVMNIIKVETLPDALVKDLCLCEYF